MTGLAGSFARRDIAYHVHPNTDMSAHESLGPHIVTSGSGIHVTDDQGRTLIEGMSGLWCAALGFSEPRLVDAARRQLETLPYNHNFAHRTSEVSIELAEKLVALAPPGLTKAHFVGSGSEANETIVKIVWYYNNLLGRPGKKKLIARRWAYHGSTIVAASLSGMPSMHAHYDLPLPPVLHVEAPHYYAGARAGESEEDYATRLAADLEALIIEEGPDTIAAFFAEPVMGAGGVMLPPKTYFAKVQAILRKYDILFVADEVITGFGRTGEWFGSDLYGIEPDLMSVAKGLSSGYQPIGAVLLSDALYQVLAEGNRRTGYFANGFTNGGHPVAAAVALETLRIYEERAIVDHVRKLGVVFRERLAQLEAAHEFVGHTRGVGLIGGIELVSDRASQKKFDLARKAAVAVVTAAREEGLILRALPNDVVGICPPLIITAEEIGVLFDRLDRALGRTAASL